MRRGQLTGRSLQNLRALRNKKAGLPDYGSISLAVLAFAALVVTSVFWGQQSASAQIPSCTTVQITSTTGYNVFYGLDATPPAISGDGTHIAFVSSANIVGSENSDLNQELFVYDGTKQTTKQIT